MGQALGNRKKSANRSKGYIVAIDGPSGAGKSTVSRLLARAIDGKLLDTGSMYRAVAFHCLRYNASIEKDCRLVAKQLRFSYDRRSGHLRVNGQRLKSEIRTEEVGTMASFVSQFMGVRRVLTHKQRQLARALSMHTPVVVEGRDIGTVVFPKTPYKFFVTANETERARRRWKELTARGVKISLSEVVMINRRRDRQDRTRKIAPLRKARGAVVVDTSRMEIEEVVRWVRARIEKKRTFLGALRCKV